MISKLNMLEIVTLSFILPFEQKLRIAQLSSQFTRFRWYILIGKPLQFM